MQVVKSKISIKHPVVSWKEKIWRRLGMTHQPTIILYSGYGHAEQLVVYGHAFLLAPLQRKKYSTFFLKNLLALLRLFIIKPIAGASVQLTSAGTKVHSMTDTDGFLKLEWRSEIPLAFGWHNASVQLFSHKQQPIAEAFGSFLVPHSTQFGFISDIDDTFLISHSSSFRKRLAVLFTRNPRTRHAFDGVIKHYHLLSKAHTIESEPNPFFYVSSSEWNLYNYISEFITVNGLPKGVLLLSPIKNLVSLFFSRQNKHKSKTDRIIRILKAFPKQKFILLGDSAQQDPVIYASIANNFPGRIHAVYIRDIYRRKSNSAKAILQKLEKTGVPTCFFAHSAEAIMHSKKIGLIR